MAATGGCRARPRRQVLPPTTCARCPVSRPHFVRPLVSPSTARATRSTSPRRGMERPGRSRTFRVRWVGSNVEPVSVSCASPSCCMSVNGFSQVDTWNGTSSAVVRGSGQRCQPALQRSRPVRHDGTGLERDVVELQTTPNPTGSTATFSMACLAPPLMPASQSARLRMPARSWRHSSRMVRNLWFGGRYPSWSRRRVR